MDLQAGFDKMWNRFDDFELPEEQPNFCRFAQKFSEWVGELLKITPNPSIVSVNQAKVLLLDKYFDWYRAVPTSHRRIADKGHVCIYQVFRQAYEQLKVVELSLTPPMLFLPSPPPPPPPAPQIAGIFMGELEER
jgi:hypothetical protein